MLNKIMAITTLISSGIAVGANGMENTDTLQIKLDKGELIIDRHQSEEPYSLRYEMPNECSNTKLESSFQEGKLTIRHVGASCSRGAKVVVSISDSTKKAQVDLTSGFMRVSPSIFRKVGKFEALVEAGMIHSEAVTSTRTSNAAGMKAHYEKSGRPLTLEVVVKAGMLEI